MNSFVVKIKIKFQLHHVRIQVGSLITIKEGAAGYSILAVGASQTFVTLISIVISKSSNYLSKLVRPKK